MTLKKLAQVADCSVATVSKAFSGSREISEQTRERIFRLAKELGCFDKYYKAPRERPIIALLTPEPESEYYAREVGALEHALNERGMDTVIGITRFDPKKEEHLFRELAYGMKVDGFVLWGSGRLIRNPEEIPLIALTSVATQAQNVDLIKTDIFEGILSLVRTVKEYGHTEVGFLGEMRTKSKEILFRRAMRLVGLPIHNKYIHVSNYRFERAGEDGMERLLQQGELPSVLIAAYDQIAYGAMRYAKRHGCLVPEELSFAGMDDISVTGYLDTPLTSIHLHFEDVCNEIASLLSHRIENRHYRSRTQITVKSTLKLRPSLYNKNALVD